MTRGSYSNGVGFGDSPLIAVGAGKSPVCERAELNGVAELAAADTEQLVAELQPTGWPDNAGELCEIVSDNAADVGVAYLVEGLDESFELQTEIVVLNGTTPVVIPGTWTRFNDILNVGTLNHVGIVGVTGQSSLNVFIAASPFAQRSRQARFSCPADYYAQIITAVGTMTKFTGGQDDGAIIHMKIRTDVEGDVFRREFVFGLQREGSTTTSIVETLPPAIEGPFDLEATVEGSRIGLNVSMRTNILLQVK